MTSHLWHWVSDDLAAEGHRHALEDLVVLELLIEARSDLSGRVFIMLNIIVRFLDRRALQAELNLADQPLLEAGHFILLSHMQTQILSFMIFPSSYQLIQSLILFIQAHIRSSLCPIIYSVSYPTLISLFLIFHLVFFLSSVSFYFTLQPEGTSGGKCVLMTHHNNNCRFKTQLQKHTPS